MGRWTHCALVVGWLASIYVGMSNLRPDCKLGRLATYGTAGLSEEVAAHLYDGPAVQITGNSLSPREDESPLREPKTLRPASPWPFD